MALEPEILVVDSDVLSRTALCALLAPLTRVDAVSSGEEALAHARDREYATILVDLRLPDADGFTIVTELRKIPLSKNVPVLFLTDAPPDWLTERKGYALGALGYITKPVDPESLRTRLEVLVLLYRRGHELRHRDDLIESQHAALDEAKAALEQAAEANRTKDLYLGVLGHDLRNPLSAILLSSRMLLMRSSLIEDDRRTLNRIARNAERMATLIRDILDYARKQAPGGLPVVPRPVDMGEVCASMIEELGLLYAGRNIELETRGTLKGEWDRGRIEQVLSNLLGNALQHGEGTITVMAEGREEDVLLRVRNFGGAIADAELPLLFEPFRRGSGSKSGLGLGLYIVREIMRAHGGSIDVASSEREGTVFTTRWPRVEAATDGGSEGDR